MILDYFVKNHRIQRQLRILKSAIEDREFTNKLAWGPRRDVEVIMPNEPAPTFALSFGSYITIVSRSVFNALGVSRVEIE